MLGAIVLLKYKAGYLMGYELDIAYIAMAFSLMSCNKCDCGICPICKANKEKETKEETATDSE